MGNVLKKLLKAVSSEMAGTRPTRSRRSPLAVPERSYAGDYAGTFDVVYAPEPDGEPDPGEIVWTWVPYEEDHTRGKDRPVLLVGHADGALLGLMLTTRDHTGEQDGRSDFIDIGTGSWDHQRRPSEVRLDRVLRVDPTALRREGAILDEARFAQVAEALRTRRRVR